MLDPQSYDEARLPYLTADIEGIGGHIKQQNEDFVVEELPLFQLRGTGDHVHFEIEKDGLTTFAAIQAIAGRLRRDPEEFGFAGLKDAHGITRQWLSLDRAREDELRALSMDRIRVLEVKRHDHKLKLGHLRGNRFTVQIRGVAHDAARRAASILDVLVRRGCPNYFGVQRFGARGDNALIGLAILEKRHADAIALVLGRPNAFDRGPVRRARELFDQGEVGRASAAWPASFRDQIHLCRALLKFKDDAARAFSTLPPNLRRLFVSAWQSEMFNRVLARRIDRVDRVLDGDVAWIHASGKCFIVEDANAEQPRCDRLEISPTGPLFGHRMLQPRLAAKAEEDAVMPGDEKALRRWPWLERIDGERRPLRVAVQSAELATGKSPGAATLRVSFELPAGAYATNVTRELCKNPKVEPAPPRRTAGGTRRHRIH